jgi:hypothetical protein
MKTSFALSAVMILLAGCTPETYGAGACPNTLPSWREPGAVGHQIPAFFVSVDENTAVGYKFWRGYRMDRAVSLDREALSELLRSVPNMLPAPMVILQPRPLASCLDVEAIRGEMEAILDCKNGQCGEGTGWTEFPEDTEALD